ncbi:membrane nuclease MnuA [Mycoplasmopsis canis UFG1]|uniref:MnuA family membrane nuclease n=1 Tax=Mycoplasmopsis canis TaxID=29555 RepID=UPI00025B095E|nr:nuclease [Mycoplasmopsis canis]EIE41263.1 membrane nuclease MnuA [Mycoplasmopsis canis UFG1]
MKKTKKRKKNKLLSIIGSIAIIISGGVTAGYFLIKQNNTQKSNTSTQSTNIESSKTNNANQLKITSWNIANFGASSSKKLGFRIQALKEIIKKENLEFISIQEVGYEDWEGVEKLVEELGYEYSFAKSPMGLISEERPNSRESYAIIYKNNKVKLLNDKGYFKGKNIQFTRPLWYSKWEIIQNGQNFWIINGHLDAPGKSSTKGVNEAENPTINNYKWKGQGDQEVREYLDIKYALEELKQKDPNSLIIFNGDTNIKKENFKFSSDFYTNLGYEINYDTNIYNDLYATSLNKGKNYSNPYDKFIAYDPNNVFIESKFEKFDLINVFKDVLDRKKYSDLFKQTYNDKNKQQKSDPDMVIKISDHTFINAYIEIK